MWQLSPYIALIPFIIRAASTTSSVRIKRSDCPEADANWLILELYLRIYSTPLSEFIYKQYKTPISSEATTIFLYQIKLVKLTFLGL